MDLVAAALEGLVVQLLPYACLGGKHLGQDFCAACDVEYGVVCNAVFGTVGFEDGFQPILDFFGSFNRKSLPPLCKPSSWILP